MRPSKTLKIHIIRVSLAVYGALYALKVFNFIHVNVKQIFADSNVNVNVKCIDEIIFTKQWRRFSFSRLDFQITRTMCSIPLYVVTFWKRHRNYSPICIFMRFVKFLFATKDFAHNSHEYTGFLSAVRPRIMAYRIAFYCKGFLQTYFARIRSLTTVSSHMVCQMASVCKRISNMHRANTVCALCLVITMLMPRQMSTFSQRFREHNAGIRIFLRCAP